MCPNGKFVESYVCYFPFDDEEMFLVERYDYDNRGSWATPCTGYQPADQLPPVMEYTTVEAVPTQSPSSSPTSVPIASAPPSNVPTMEPTQSIHPIAMPSVSPTVSPVPTDVPTIEPTQSHYPSDMPTVDPTASAFPSSGPTMHPTTNSPTASAFPSSGPTVYPTTISPTASTLPSSGPTLYPTQSKPTIFPSSSPTMKYPVPGCQFDQKVGYQCGSDTIVCNPQIYSPAEEVCDQQPVLDGGKLYVWEDSIVLGKNQTCDTENESCWCQHMALGVSSPSINADEVFSSNIACPNGMTVSSYVCYTPLLGGSSFKVNQVEVVNDEGDSMVIEPCTGYQPRSELPPVTSYSTR
jgi:hypothetical protein